MAQTAVNSEPTQAYEGKVENSVMWPTTDQSFLTEGTIYFGKFVALKDNAQLTKGEQIVKLPAAATDITGPLGMGVAVADVTKAPLSSIGSSMAWVIPTALLAPPSSRTALGP